MDYMIRGYGRKQSDQSFCGDGQGNGGDGQAVSQHQPGGNGSAGKAADGRRHDGMDDEGGKKTF